MKEYQIVVTGDIPVELQPPERGWKPDFSCRHLRQELRDVPGWQLSALFRVDMGSSPYHKKSRANEEFTERIKLGMPESKLNYFYPLVEATSYSSKDVFSPVLLGSNPVFVGVSTSSKFDHIHPHLNRVPMPPSCIFKKTCSNPPTLNNTELWIGKLEFVEKDREVNMCRTHSTFSRKQPVLSSILSSIKALIVGRIPLNQPMTFSDCHI